MDSDGELMRITSRLHYELGDKPALHRFSLLSIQLMLL
jgi:hypothetical protein